MFLLSVKHVSLFFQRTFDSFMNTIRKVAYCGAALLQEEEVEDDATSIATTATVTTTLNERRRRRWKIDDPPFPPITHCSNARFDWKILAD